VVFYFSPDAFSKGETTMVKQARVNIRKYHEWMRADKRVGGDYHKELLKRQESGVQEPDKEEDKDGSVFFINTYDEAAIEAFINALLGQYDRKNEGSRHRRNGSNRE
jgi:hypothetical protein